MSASFTRFQSTRQFTKCDVFYASAKTYSHAGALLLLLPAALMFLTGFVYPLARLVALSMPDTSSELYIRIFRDPLYLNVLFSTTVVALAVMCCRLLPGFPSLRDGPVKHPGPHIDGDVRVIPPGHRSGPIICLIAASENRHINQALLSSKLIDEPLRMIYTQGAVIVAMTHAFSSFFLHDHAHFSLRHCGASPSGVRSGGST